MKDWYLKLTSREKMMVLSAASVVALFTFYLLLWAPVAGSYTKLKNNVAMAENTISWMKSAANEVSQLRGSGGTVAERPQGKQFVLGLVDKTAKSAGLGAVLKRVQPEGETGVKIWFESAPFDELIIWLDTIQSEHGLVVNEINVEQTDSAGLVNVRVSLES
jgi:general secretion pathway protein M